MKNLKLFINNNLYRKQHCKTKTRSYCKQDNQVLAQPLELALKHVLVISPNGEGYFNWKGYMNTSNDDYSKQYYLRLLNSLEKLNILELKHF